MNEQLHFDQLLDNAATRSDIEQLSPEQHRETVELFAELMRRIVSPDVQRSTEIRGEFVEEGVGDD